MLARDAESAQGKPLLSSFPNPTAFLCPLRLRAPARVCFWSFLLITGSLETLRALKENPSIFFSKPYCFPLPPAPPRPCASMLLVFLTDHTAFLCPLRLRAPARECFWSFLLIKHHCITSLLKATLFGITILWLPLRER